MAFNLIAGVAGLKYGFPRVLVREGRVGNVLVGGMLHGDMSGLQEGKCRRVQREISETCGTNVENMRNKCGKGAELFLKASWGVNGNTKERPVSDRPCLPGSSGICLLWAVL